MAHLHDATFAFPRKWNKSAIEILCVVFLSGCSTVPSVVETSNLTYPESQEVSNCENVSLGCGGSKGLTNGGLIDEVKAGIASVSVLRCGITVSRA